MRLPFPDIPRRAATVAVALALIASMVSGVEEPAADKPVAPQPAPAADTPAKLPDLDLDKLNRAREGKKVTDLFAPKTVVPPPPPAAAVTVAQAPAAPPPPPSAPPLPFRYFGKWVEKGRTVVFLWNNSEGFSAAAGDTVDGHYRIESVTDSSIDFVYLPLGSKQTLSIAAPE